MKVKIKSLGLAHFFKQCMLLLHHLTDHRNKHFISNHLSEECLLENSTQQQRLQNELLLFKFLPFSEEKLLENSTEKKITKLNKRTQNSAFLWLYQTLRLVHQLFKKMTFDRQFFVHETLKLNIFSCKKFKRFLPRYVLPNTLLCLLDDDDNNLSLPSNVSCSYNFFFLLVKFCSMPLYWHLLHR